MGFFDFLKFKDDEQLDQQLEITQEISEQQDQYQLDGEQEQLVAVITAAIACALNTSTYNLNIKSLKHIDQRGPVWNRIGRQQLMDSRQN